MTVNKRKKVTKYRAHTTHGGGSMKKRRGAGHRGGRGAAGSGKRADVKKPSIWKARYFGKFGFKSKNPTRIYPVNIDYIERNIEQFKKEGDVIDLDKLGYNKLLGKGKVSQAYKIKVTSASPKAVEKIKEAGGEVETAQAAAEN